jgi:hypothetical protein
MVAGASFLLRPLRKVRPRKPELARIHIILARCALWSASAISHDGTERLVLLRFRREWESNPRWGLCRPLPYRLAIPSCSGGGARTHDLEINSFALLPTELPQNYLPVRYRVGLDAQQTLLTGLRAVVREVQKGTSRHLDDTDRLPALFTHPLQRGRYVVQSAASAGDVKPSRPERYFWGHTGSNK